MRFVPVPEFTAMVVTKDREGCTTTFRKDRFPTHLPVVDPFEHEGVWTIVDGIVLLVPVPGVSLIQHLDS